MKIEKINVKEVSLRYSDVDSGYFIIEFEVVASMPTRPHTLIYDTKDDKFINYYLSILDNPDDVIYKSRAGYWVCENPQVDLVQRHLDKVSKEEVRKAIIDALL